MKKHLCIIMLAALLVTLVGCNFAEFLQMKSEPQVEQMLAALSEGDAELALSLMHPEEADAERIAQLIDYLDGRQVEKMTRTGIHKSAHAGVGNTYKEESASFMLQLDDGTNITLSVVYLTDSDGEGFSTFSIQLG